MPVCKAQQTSLALPYCRVLPSGEFNGMIKEPLSGYAESFVMYSCIRVLVILLTNDVLPNKVTGYRPVASFLIKGGCFPRILDLSQGLKIGVPSGCLGKTSISKIIMVDDVTLCMVKARIYMA